MLKTFHSLLFMILMKSVIAIIIISCSLHHTVLLEPRHRRVAKCRKFDTHLLLLPLKCQPNFAADVLIFLLIILQRK